MLSDLNLGQIENDINYNFKNLFDEDKDIFDDNMHSCEYYEIDEFKNKFKNYNESFSTYSHNVRSINGHWNDILDLIYSVQPNKFSVLAFQEIWSVQQNYEIPGYGKLEFITRDKNGPPRPNCGGGVGLFIDNKYKDYEILKEESIFLPHVYESIWVKIKIKNGKDKIIGNVYRPNTAPLANLEQALNIHSQILDQILANKNHAKCEIQILSDFNVNLLNFETHGLTSDYIDYFISKSFLPIITLPTRIKHQSASLIDHIWTNKACNVYNSGILINSLSDHFPVFYIEEGKQKKFEMPEKITRKINAKTIPAFCNILKSTKWHSITSETNPANAFTKFFDIFNSARDMAFPVIRVKPKPIIFKHSPWMTPGLKISQKTKELLFSKKLKCPNVQNFVKFKEYNKIYNRLRRSAKKLYYDKQFKLFSKNSKQTWSLIREVIGTSKQKNQLPNFFRENGQLISDTLEIANGFNTFFSGIGPKLASEIDSSDRDYKRFLPDENPVDFEFSKVSEIDILRICDELKPKLSSGADF